MIRMTVDGSPYEGRDGQTIAGVLIANDQKQWRTAPDGNRGVFCGIGICHDCLVTVNGIEGVRACQREASDGDDITREVRS